MLSRLVGRWPLMVCLSLWAARVPAAPAPAAPPAAPAAVQPAPAVASPAAAVAPPAPRAPAAAKVEDDLGRPESVEIQVRRLADQLAAGMKDRRGQGRYDRWAVTPFSELGDDVKKRHLGEIVAEQVEGSLKRDHGFICVERMKLAKLVQEAALAESGIIDEKDAPKLGELANADLLVVGSVGLLGDTYVVNIRAVATDSAKVVAAATARFHASGLVALSSEAVVLRTKSDALFRSVLIPGWGQLYNRQKQKAVTIWFLGGALLGGGIVSASLGRSAEYAYTRPEESKAACEGQTSLSNCVVELRTKADTRYAAANLLFIGYGLLHVYNILDAYMSGYEPDASTQRLYGESAIDWRPDGIAVRF
jgi:hypothetical protein